MISQNAKLLKKYGYDISIPGILQHTQVEGFRTTNVDEIQRIVADCNVRELDIRRKADKTNKEAKERKKHLQRKGGTFVIMGFVGLIIWLMSL